MQLHQPTPRDFPTRGGSFQSGKDLHHFDQDYHDGIPLESDDYLGSLARGAEDDRSYMFGQQVFFKLIILFYSTFHLIIHSFIH